MDLNREFKSKSLFYLEHFLKPPFILRRILAQNMQITVVLLSLVTTSLPYELLYSLRLFWLTLHGAAPCVFSLIKVCFSKCYEARKMDSSFSLREFWKFESWFPGIREMWRYLKSMKRLHHWAHSASCAVIENVFYDH